MSAIRGVVCTFCGCTCDDLEVSVEGNQVKAVKYACAIGMEKMSKCVEERDPRILVRSNGRLEEASLEEALDRAAEILASSKYPLLYGWSNTSCEAIKVGIELAEELGGVIDNTSCVCHGPGIEAAQEVGIVEGTLGQARHRADLIVYWGCNPLQAHMRHLARYTVMSSGLFRAGRKDRKLVVVDVRKTSTAKLANMFLQVEPGMDYELIQAIRMAIQDEEIEADKVAGVPVEQIEELADLMVSCEFGFLFFGLGLTQPSAKNENIAAAISLIQDLNLKTKWLLLPMRGHHNVTGANKVTLWETGYPFAVDFSHGYPRYNPGETSSVDLLTRREVDAALIVASDPVAHMPAQTAKAFTEIPMVVVDPLMTASALLADVRIPAAFVGVETEGTIYRMDGVPLRAKKLVEPPEGILPDKVILTTLLERVRKLRRR